MAKTMIIAAGIHRCSLIPSTIPTTKKITGTPPPNPTPESLFDASR